MLDEYKQLYKASADHIKDWETLDKNDLCKTCIKHENNQLLYNQYLAALVVRYWGLIPKFYAISTNLAEPLDCYNWLIDSIIYTLKHRRWEDKNAAIYNDPKGPDKMINRCMKSSRLIYYQFHNRKKRKKEYQLVSIDELKESFDSDYIDIEDESAAINEQEIDMEYFISEIFKRKEYFLAFILDCICNEDVFDSTDTSVKFNIKHLAKRFKSIDEKYLHIFSEKYDIDYDQVYQAAILAKNIPDSKLRMKIEDTLLRLKHSELVKNILGD